MEGGLSLPIEALLPCTASLWLRHRVRGEELRWSKGDWASCEHRTSKLSLEEFYILAQTYELGGEKFNDLFETAVRMFPNDQVANLNAANSAISKGDYRSALRYLDKAGDMPEAIYTRGVLEVYREDNQAAKPYLEKALKLGITEAKQALEEIAKNRNIVTKNNK